VNLKETNGFKDWCFRCISVCAADVARVGSKGRLCQVAFAVPP